MISIGVFISTIIWLVTVMFGSFVIYNLFNKNKKLEDALIKSNTLLENLRKVVSESDQLINNVDKLGAFKSDDEVGYFFNLIKEIQAALNKYLA